MKGTNHHVPGGGGEEGVGEGVWGGDLLIGITYHQMSITLNHHIPRNSLPRYHPLNKVSTLPSIGVILTPLPLTPCSSLQQVF